MDKENHTYKVLVIKPYDKLIETKKELAYYTFFTSVYLILTIAALICGNQYRESRKDLSLVNYGLSCFTSVVTLTHFKGLYKAICKKKKLDKKINKYIYEEEYLSNQNHEGKYKTK